MTIFRSDAMIEVLLDPRQHWHAGELQTLTGYYPEEFVSLRERLSVSDSKQSEEDRAMLVQAANTLLGYPSIDERVGEEMLGEDWSDQVRAFLDHERERRDHPISPDNF